MIVPLYPELASYYLEHHVQFRISQYNMHPFTEKVTRPYIVIL
jgi:hypothetical protein